MMTNKMTHSLAIAAVVTGLAFGLASPAHASLISTKVTEIDPDVGNLVEQNFLGSLLGSATESFEGFNLGDAENGTVPGPVNTTSVGTFTATGEGGGNLCIKGGNNTCDRLQILDKDSSPFSGRFAVNQDGTTDTKDGDNTGQWLDSNDISKMVWDLSAIDGSYNAFGFYLTDGADVGAELEVSFADGPSEQLVLLDNEENGTLYYISAIASEPILNATVTFQNGDLNNGDGWGMDRMTVGKVPAPATLGLLGAGLVGLGLIGWSRRT